MEILLALSVIVPSFFILFKLINRMEEIQYQNFKDREALIEKLHKKEISLIEKNWVIKDDLQANSIEDKTDPEIPLDETSKIPIVDGMKIKYDDSEEVFPVTIQ